MRTTTLKFHVVGDSYDELTSAADVAISKFLRSEDDDYEFDEEYDEPARHNVNYELVVSENMDQSDNHQYTAEVIARIKDVR